MSDQITLVGGPSDGAQITRPNGRSLLVFDTDKREVAASYRQGRNRDQFTFRGMTRLVVNLPAPGATNAN